MPCPSVYIERVGFEMDKRYQETKLQVLISPAVLIARDAFEVTLRIFTSLKLESNIVNICFLLTCQKQLILLIISFTAKYHHFPRNVWQFSFL